jgi:ribonuclease HI
MWTKEKILKRETGWTEDSFTQFAGRKHGENKKGEEVWTPTFIKNLEKSLSFKNFTTLEEFQSKIISIDQALIEGTQRGINHVNSLKVEFETHDCLLKNKENYDPMKPIFHLVKKDFAPDEKGSYSLFTDGCFKSIGSNSFASCAGWIMDNNTNEIVIEFTKTVDLNPENIKGKGMPNFELVGISEGIKLIDHLGLRNVQCYTDTNSEAKLILSAMNDVGEKRYNEEVEFYEPIVNILKKTNSVISWVPREYNSHADELTKVPLNAWLAHYTKLYIEKDHIKENGYVIDREKEIYFHHPKFEYKQPEQLESRWTVISTSHSTDNKGKNKFMVSMLYDRESDSMTLLDNKVKDFSHIDESLPEEVKRVKKAKPDTIAVTELCNAINLVKDLDHINVCAPPGTIAVCKKLTPIHPILQEEYFEFHRTFTDFPGKITLTNIDKDLQKKVQKFLEREYPLLVSNEKERKLKI